MPNELAAMAKTPSGATMTVVIICAPQMTMCSTPIGRPMCRALRTVPHVGRKLPRSPFSFRSLERAIRYHIINPATTASAAAVPNAAPVTPSPAPGMCRLRPNHSTSRVGKIRKKLNTTSSTHISTLSKPGTRILPLHRSMLPARKLSWSSGRERAKIRK